MPYLGAHESVSGGLYLAFARISQVGGEALQLFTRNQRQWRHKPLSEAERAAFHEAREQHQDMIVASHASYLMNLAARDEALRGRSIQALVEELQRCAQLDLPFIVLHPGAHGGDGSERGVERVVSALDEVLAAVESSTMVLIETTAGQGTGIGGRFEELAAICSLVKQTSRIGVCFDTCHVFAAGYDIRDERSYRETMARFDQLIGLERLLLFHLNDSKNPLGSRVDRHDHIGAGRIGLNGFRCLLNDPRFSNHAMILETPKADDLHEDIVNLNTLRGLLEDRP